MENLVTTFFNHNHWANLLLCDACLSLTEEQLDYSDKGAFGSIRMTLEHIARAEERYLYHLIRWEPAISNNKDNPPDVANLKARLQHTGPILQNTALTLSPDKDIQIGEGEEAEFISAKVILLQVIHHAHEHRTQIASMLGQLGIQPPSLSGWDYHYEVLLQD